MSRANRNFLLLTTRLSVVMCMGALSAAAQADNVVFSGAEGSSNSSYTYLGTVIPMEGEALGRGWYRKVVVSMIRYRFSSTDRGPSEDVYGPCRASKAGSDMHGDSAPGHSICRQQSAPATSG